MSELKIITRDSLKAEADEKILAGYAPNSENMVNIVTPSYGFGASQSENFNAIQNSQIVGHTDRLIVDREKLKIYGSAYDMPVYSATLKKKMSTREMINSGIFASANTLPADWQTLWDAMRIDISIRSASHDVVRGNFYNVLNMPDADRVIKIDEFFKYALIFAENNGEGQAVPQGETRFGQTDSITTKIYAAGWTWTLLNEMFNKKMDPQRLSDSVIEGYNFKRDDMAMSPILNFSYSGVQQTAANVTAGAEREELLYKTMEDAFEDYGKRKDPVDTNKFLDPSGCTILATAQDARHIARVARGLPSVNQKVYNSLSEISNIVAYDTETIQGRVKSETYAGVTPGKAYLIKKNRYMNIAVKRNLTLETDQTPDVTTLAREKRAWYFAEALHTDGVGSFIQEITLPAW